VTGSRKIDGVVDVSMKQMENKLVLRFDRRVTTGDRVTAAVQAVVDNIDQ
jgi:hypothetical protein